MFGTFWKISVRNVLKHKTYSAINILGLALGFSAFIIIGLFISHELSWDKSNEKYDRIYRIQRFFANAHSFDGNEISPHTRAITAPLLEKRYPEFEKITVIQASWAKFLSVTPENQVYAETGIFADSCYFDVFTYRFIEGQQRGSMTDPFTIALSETMAKKLFPNGNALGKTVSLEKKYDMKVVGIYQDLPDNSTIKPDFIGSFNSLAQISNTSRNSAYSGDVMTFALLKPDVNVKNLESKIRNTFSGFRDLEYEELQLCPMSKVYLDYNGRGQYYFVLILYGLIGLFILIMAASNYINMVTANASNRRKEVAVKKVNGSSRFDLFLQFIGETMVISMMALIVAFAIAKSFLPVFSNIVDREIILSFAANWQFILFTFCISMSIGILSGIYPALFMSSQKIVALFKREVFTRAGESFSLKRILVVSQFSISVFLILFTLSFSMQIRYLFQKDLGFNKENVIYTKLTASNKGIHFNQLRNRILEHPEFVNASMSKHIPFVSFGGGMTNWEGGSKDEQVVCRFNQVSYDFVKNMGIKVVAGRDFSPDFQGDANNACLINETAVRNFGWTNPIGKRLNDNKLIVVGVVQDYIYKDMHNAIEPAILTLAPDEISGTWTFAFRVEPNSQQKAMAILNHEFEAAFPNDPFEFQDLPTSFATDNTIKIYRAVNRTVLFFTAFNIFLAMIGLLGLVSYTVARRTKEIGVRKINGSTVSSIFFLLSKEYFVLLLFSLIIAFPTAWWAYEKMPGANKLHAQPWIFAFGAIVIFIIILITTSWQTYKAATRNPVEALRYE
jgi:ABC-type transport system, involved in lipoprotein release, permease component